MKTSSISTASAVFPEPSRVFGNKNKCMQLFCLMLTLNLGDRVRRWKRRDWLLDKLVAIKRKMLKELFLWSHNKWNKTLEHLVSYCDVCRNSWTKKDLSWCSKVLISHKTSSTGSQTCQSVLNWWESWTRCSLQVPSNGMILFYFSIFSINFT